MSTLVAHCFSKYLLSLTNFPVNAVWPEMVEQVLHDVHLVGIDVVEGYGAVAAAAHPLYNRVVDVLLVPEVVRHVARNEVVLRHEGKKSASSEGVSTNRMRMRRPLQKKPPIFLHTFGPCFLCKMITKMEIGKAFAENHKKTLLKKLLVQTLSLRPRHRGFPCTCPSRRPRPRPRRTCKPYRFCPVYLNRKSLY